MFSAFLNYPLCDLAWSGTFCAWAFVLSHAPRNGSEDREAQEAATYIRHRAHAIAWILTGCVAVASLISIGGPALASMG